MRPALKAGLRPLWRDRDTLQIGVDPRRARALTGLGKAAAIVSLLDGSRDTAEVARTAATYGIGQDAVDKILGLLASAGVLDDFPAGLRAALPGYLLERIAPELACAALAYGHGDGGAAVLARRRAAFARVYGAGRVGACIATFLAASGVAWVSCVDAGPTAPADITPAGPGLADVGARRPAAVARAVHRVAREVRTADDSHRLPDLAVLTGRPDPVVLDDLMRHRVPHLVAHADEAIGVVGPLVRPGQSACVRCLDLSKTARDPAWPRILAQAGGAGGPVTVPQACDTVLAAATAALAAAQALTLIDRAGQPAAANGTLELVLPDWQWQRRGWPPHPACTCGAASALRRPWFVVLGGSRAVFGRGAGRPCIRARAVLEIGDVQLGRAVQEPVRVGQIVGRRQQVRVRPQRVPALDPALGGDVGPQHRRLAQHPGPELEPDQGGEGPLGRPPGRPPAPDRLGQRRAVHEP
jgi:bacteriocin biosynthesis cyclodehydratase domain-containing protein